MNSVVPPLRMQPASTMHHQPQQYHPHPSTTAAAKPRHHQRHPSNQQNLYAAGPRPQQYPRQQPHQQPQPQNLAAHEDVLARAQAIARAQAQIQAQMQSYANQPQPQSNIFYGQAFATSARGSASAASGANMRPSNASTVYSSSSSSSSASASHGRHARPQPQQTLHQLHQRSTATTSPVAAQQQQQPTAAASSNASSRVEWRVAVDPKSKRPYYYHPLTRETTWKKPQALVEKETREKKQFFLSMENNIRTKLRTGTWLQGDNGDDHAPYRHSDIGVSSASSAMSHAAHALDPARNSLSSMDRKPRTFGIHGSRSAPNTPEFAALSLKPTSVKRDSSNQDGSTDDDDDELDEDEDGLTAAASKPPLLFRTLSSYETPVVMEKKHGGSGVTSGIVGSKLVTIPSPIQERVRLAVTGSSSAIHQQPRASDLESYTQSTGRPDPLIANTSSSSMVRQPLRRRSNSTSTIYVRMGTMNAPDQDCTIKCVATVLRAHMVEAVDAPIAIDPKFDVFINRRDRERMAHEASLVHSFGADGMADSMSLSYSERSQVIPSLKEIAALVKHVFSRAQMESECIIMSLIYVERLLKATSGSLQLRTSNWRSILFCSMVMASKVWDDLSMCNADFSKIWPELTLKEINELELVYLSAVEYNVRVSAVSYAKYYFHLRSMCATMGMLAAFDESAPLNLDGARKMQVLSEEYQERSKLMPAPRRRSVTITATTVESSRSAAAGGNKQNNKPSPAASLEQLVHMQVRGAGGSSLASMHRLSGKN